MPKFDSTTRRHAFGLAAAALLAVGTGAAVMAADPPAGHGAIAAAPSDAMAELHERAMALAHAMAYGATPEDLAPAMKSLAREMAPAMGQDQAAVEAHFAEMGRQIIDARKAGPAALHQFMMTTFGGH